jgi:vitamin B12 transporter
MFKKFFILLSVFFIIINLSFSETNKKKEKEDETIVKETIVVTATSLEENSKSVIGQFSIIDSAQIKNWKFANLSEALTFSDDSLSFTMGGYGQLSSTFVRGASSKQTVFMINGIKINDPASLSLDVSPISANVFNRIEIIDGPQSTLYGSEAMGGAVNLISKANNGISFSAMGGENSTYNGNLNIGKTYNNINFSLNYNYFSTNGIYDNNDFKNSNLLSSVSFNLGKTKISPFFYIIDSRIGIPFNYGVTSPQRRGQTKIRIIGLPVDYRFADNLKLRFNLGYYKRDYELKDPGAFFGKYYNSISKNYQLNGKLIYERINKQSPTILGFEILNSKIWETTDAGKSFDNKKYDSNSIYFQQILKYQKIKFVGGVRYDKYKDFKSNISPKLAVNYNLSYNKLYAGLFGIYSEGFRTPKPVEYASVWGNPNLKPEKSKNIEFGANFGYKNILFKAGYFNTKYTDLIVFNFKTYKLENSENDTIKGFNLKTIYNFGSNNISLSYMKITATNDITGEKLLRRPDYILKAAVHTEYKKGYLNLFGRFIGERKDYNEKTFGVVNADAFTVFSLTAGYKIMDNISVFVKIHNMFNKEYYEIFGYKSLPRQFYFGLNFNL